ncbi:MAG: TIM barrel protein [Bacteroidota bacterium]
MKRRDAVKTTILGLGTLSIATTCETAADSSATSKQKNTSNTTITTAMKGNIKHSVCRWCYQDIPLEQLCEGAQEIGIASIELTTPEEWGILKSHQLTSALGTRKGASLTEGFNNPKFHERLYQPYIDLIDAAADQGIETVIVFSGNRNGISAEAGIENCAIGLDKIIKHAEKRDIMVVMELLNSKVNHPDYQCDTTPWGAALVDKIGSTNFKLLYDIYHMQIMEGDIIATINQYKDYIGHYHTGGVPGRNEINQNQELNYPAIMRAIVQTGYQGFVAQEFIPTYEDQLAALKEGVMICDV